MKKISQIFLTTITIVIIFTVIYTSSSAVGASSAVPNISGTWTGTLFNVGQEEYSTIFKITQNGEQFSGTASFEITNSYSYPQDVGKSFEYSLSGTIDETGKIHITGNVLSGPPEIVSRAGIWNMDWQLSQDGEVISFYGLDQYGNTLSVTLRQNQDNTSPSEATSSLPTVTSSGSSFPMGLLLGLVLIFTIGLSVGAVWRLKIRKDQSQLPLPPPPQSSPIQETPPLSKQVQKKPSRAHSFASIGGSLAIVFSLMAFLFAFLTASDSNASMMGYPGGSSQGIALFATIGGLGLVSAIIILVSAKILNSNPQRHVQCGILILVFSIVGSSAILLYPPEARSLVIAFFVLSGWTTLAGGILAIIFKPQILIVDNQRSNHE